MLYHPPLPFPATALRRAPPTGTRASGGDLDRHCGLFAPSEGSLHGLRVAFGTSDVQGADLEVGE